MKNVNPDDVAAIMREVSAEHVLPYFGQLKKGDISFKIGDDPVTIADKKTELALSSRLLDLLPGSKVVGEEDFSVNKGVLDRFFDESPVWVIDPIDGTRNFVRGSEEFGVIVALAKQNQIIAGWIYHPTSDEFVTVEKGSGAYYNGKKLKVMPTGPFMDMWGFLGDGLVFDFEKLPQTNGKVPNFEVMTAGAHEYPRLIMNAPHFGKDKPQFHYRASLSHTTPWDDGAGVLAYQESGGYAAHWNGEAYKPSIMNLGLALAPDKESWEALKTWCMTFSKLPG